MAYIKIVELLGVLVLTPKEAFVDYNPHLNRLQRSKSNQEAAKGTIEKPDEVTNLVHQTRGNSPTDHENLLGNALEEIFGSGIVDLKDIINRLNEMGVRAPNGDDWSEKSFRSEMENLGS